MILMEKLLSLRKRMKSRKPKFRYQDSHKFKRVKTSWRRPRGLQSKIRMHIRGHQKEVAVGYKSPALVRGLHGKGLAEVYVSTIKDLEGLKKTDGVLVSGKVGTKRRLEILKACMEKGLTVLNFKSAQDQVKKIEEARTKAKTAKEHKKAETAKKEQKKEELADKVAKPVEKKDEEKQDGEKDKADEEKKKVLTGKNAVRV